MLLGFAKLALSQKRRAAMSGVPAHTGSGGAGASAAQLLRRHSWSMQGLQRISPQPRSPRSPSDCGGLPPPTSRAAPHAQLAQHAQQAHSLGASMRTASTPPKYPGSLSASRRNSGSGGAGRPPTSRASIGDTSES